LHALFRLWGGLQQSDKAFCAAAILQFLHAANDAETSFYNDAKGKLPPEKQEPMAAADVEQLMHPSARNPMVEVLRAIGDQFSKLYPPNFEGLGVDRKADRLKPDHAVAKAFHAVANVLGVEEFEVYQARRGLVTLETTEPLAVCVAQDLVRKFNAREQKFVIGRSAMGLFNKTALVPKTTAAELADVLGNSVRIHAGGFSGLGRKNDESVKQLRKVYSRKALKALEAPAAALAQTQRLDLEETIAGLRASADRAGLLICGDPAAGLNVVLREDSNQSRVEIADSVVSAVKSRGDLRALLSFALSDEFFRLRTKVGVALP
jgi:hypothetical protein